MVAMRVRVQEGMRSSPISQSGFTSALSANPIYKYNILAQEKPGCNMSVIKVPL